MEKIIMIYENRLKRWGVYIISMPLFLMALIEALNAVGRKLQIPFPCAIESVESLLVITVYFGASIVALERGHIKVDLLTRYFSLSVQNYLTILAHVLGAIGFGLLTWGAWSAALYAVKIMEVRMGEYMFPLWPFKLLFAFGMTLFIIQLIFNIIKLIHVCKGNTGYANMDTFQEVEPPL